MMTWILAGMAKELIKLILSYIEYSSSKVLEHPTHTMHIFSVETVISFQLKTLPFFFWLKCNLSKCLIYDCIPRRASVMLFLLQSKLVLDIELQTMSNFFFQTSRIVLIKLLRSSYKVWDKRSRLRSAKKRSRLRSAKICQGMTNIIQRSRKIRDGGACNSEIV